MKVELKSSILWGGQHQEAGSVLDISETDAYNLIGRDRAVPYTPPKPVEPVNRSVGLEKSDEKQNVVKRAYKRKTAAKTGH
jgi:hypothetical protein